MIRYKKFSGCWRLSGLPSVLLDPAGWMGLEVPLSTRRPAKSQPSTPRWLTFPKNRETFSAPGYAFSVIHAMLAGGVRSHLIGRETLKQNFKHSVDSHFIPWHCHQVGVAADRSLAREIRRAWGIPSPPAPSSPQPESNEVKEGSPLSTNCREKAHNCAGGRVRLVSHFETHPSLIFLETERP